MANWHLEFYQDDTGYSDGDIEIELLDIVKNQADYNAVLSNDGRWPMFYHLSELRHNVFSWYPFKKDASLLEIGSGCGAITGLFCEKVGHVTSVELTKIRSEINYERNKKYDNLDLYTGNFNVMTFPEKFDYVILNGVLEYAASFTEGDSPYITFLSTIRNLLKKDGILLIAIENRLGLKYFNGAVEDHTSMLFNGLDAYRNVDFVRTFSKTEMNTILDDSCFSEWRYYYPFPDYKFTTEILTDSTVNSMSFSYRGTNAGYDHDRLNFFDENKMLETLRTEGICDRFSNSFIIEAKKSGSLADNGIEYVKFSNNRRKDFNITTFINRENGKRVVKKTALSDGAKVHLDKMIEHYRQRKNDPGSFLYAPVYPEKEGLTMAYYQLPTMKAVLNNYLKSGRLDEFDREVEGLKAYMSQGAEFVVYGDSPDFISVFGSEGLSEEAELCQPFANIDLLFENILINRNNQKYYIIDYEWVFNFPVPVKYILWRCLFFSYVSSAEMASTFNLFELLERHGISEADHARFLLWEDHFSDEYVAGHPASQGYIKNTYDETPSLNRFLSDFNSTSEIYYGVNFAFSSETIVKVPFRIKNDHFKIIVDVALLRKAIPELNTLRIDPVNRACEMSEIQLVTETGEHLDYSTNACRETDGICLFCNDDPQIIIGNLPKTADTITLTGVIKKISLNRQIDTLIAVEDMVKRERETYKGKYLRAYEQLYHIQNSAPYKMVKPLLKARHKLKRK